MTLLCWYCCEAIRPVGYDQAFHLVCSDCYDDLTKAAVTTDITVLTKGPDPAVVAARAQYQQSYQDFLTHRDQVVNFLEQTKDLTWRLLPGYQSQPTWTQQYQANTKALTLIEEQYLELAHWLDCGLIATSYPQFKFTDTVRIIRLPHNGDSIKVVVTDYYYDNILDWVAVLDRTAPEYREALELIATNLTYNPQLTLTWLLNQPQWPWRWHRLHLNPNFDLAWLVALPQKGWDWASIAQLPQCQLSWLSQVAQLTLQNYLSLDHFNLQPKINAAKADRLTLANLTALFETEPPDTTWLVCQAEPISTYIDLNQGQGPRAMVQFLQDHQLIHWPGLCSNPTLLWLWLSQEWFWTSTASSPLGYIWRNLSLNTSLTESIFQTLYDQAVTSGQPTNWQPYHLSVNPAFDPQWLERAWFDSTVNSATGPMWQWSALSRHPRTTLAVITAHPQWPWDLYGLRNNPNFEASWLDLAQISATQWFIRTLSVHNLAKLDLVWLLNWARSQVAAQSQDIPWSMLSARQDLTWDLLAQYPELLEYWDWAMLCTNPRLVWSDHPLWRDNQAKWSSEWAVTSLCRNPATTWARVDQYPTLPWAIDLLCGNSMIVV